VYFERFFVAAKLFGRNFSEQNAPKGRKIRPSVEISPNLLTLPNSENETFVKNKSVLQIRSVVSIVAPTTRRIRRNSLDGGREKNQLLATFAFVIKTVSGVACICACHCWLAQEGSKKIFSSIARILPIPFLAGDK
jgi:hypothetical protein